MCDEKMNVSVVEDDNYSGVIPDCVLIAKTGDYVVSIGKQNSRPQDLLVR